MSDDWLAHELKPIVEEALAVIQETVPTVESVYIVGSVAASHWQPAMSDLDVVVVVANPSVTVTEAALKQALGRVNTLNLVTFVDCGILVRSNLTGSTPDLAARGHAFKIAMTGVLVWGSAINAQKFLPHMAQIAQEQVDRAVALMAKYRRGDIIGPFLRNEQLLARSCAKAAMRVVSAITVLRGASYSAIPHDTVAAAQQFAPEMLQVAEQAMAIILGRMSCAPPAAMELVDHAAAAFRRRSVPQDRPNRNQTTRTPRQIGV